MPRLLIANDCPEQVAGQDASFSDGLSLWAQRILWYMKENDIIVLPVEPAPGYLNYIAKLKQICPDTIRIIIPPTAEQAHLSQNRILEPALCDMIRAALNNQTLSTVLPLIPDAAVVTLAAQLGVEDKVPAAAFASQGGGALANCKSVFRAIASGVCAPIPAGGVTRCRQQAETIIADIMFNQGHATIIKKDFGQGCRGNEVLSPTAGITANGGRRCVVLPGRQALYDYLESNWDWLTNDGTHNLVIERYYPDSIAIFAEYHLSDDKGVKLTGLGEMLALPIADGQVVPPVGLSPTILAEIVDHGQRLSHALHTMGYRGNLSADAIVTPAGEVMFSEYNCRITGSTHLYAVVGEEIIGKGWHQKRILLERRGWQAPSFKQALLMLEKSGLAYCPIRKDGIILTGTFIPERQVISYTVVAKDLESAKLLEKKLHAVSPREAVAIV